MSVLSFVKGLFGRLTGRQADRTEKKTEAALRQRSAKRRRGESQRRPATVRRKEGARGHRRSYLPGSGCFRRRDIFESQLHRKARAETGRAKTSGVTVR